MTQIDEAVRELVSQLDSEHVAERGAQRQGRRHFVDDRTQEIWPVAHRSPSPSKQIQLFVDPYLQVEGIGSSVRSPDDRAVT